MNAKYAIGQITAALSGPIATEFGAFMVLNQAAMAMESQRGWKYLVRTTRGLAYRAVVSGGLASFTASSSTLTLTGAFANYVLVPGDYVTLTLDGAAAGSFPIVSRVGADSLTIDSPAISTDYTGTVSFVVDTSRVGLPTGVGRILDVVGSDAYNNSAYASSVSELTYSDSLRFNSSSFQTGYAVEWASLTEKSIPVQTLRIWAQPDANEASALHVVHLRAWPEVTSEVDVIPIPAYMDMLFMDYVRAFASAYENAELLGTMMKAIRASGTYSGAVEHDTRSGSEMGLPTNTAIQPPSMSSGHFGDPNTYTNIPE